MLAEWQLMFVLLSLPGFLLAAALLALREPVRRERLAPGKVPLEIIEVQSGSYLGEDDIVRFEDTYGRQ